MQKNGHTTVCGLTPFPFGSTCKFECDDGYELPEGGKSLVTCIIYLPGVASPTWDDAPTLCKSTYHL